MIALDFTQWAALWYIGGMISGALVMIAFILTLIFFIFAHSFFLNVFQPVFLPAVPADFSLSVVIYRS